MASTYSTNLKIELMATGENSGTWGGITNTNLGTALEQAIVGYGNPEYLSDATLTISLADSNAAQIARALVLNVTSVLSLTTTRELVVPTIQKQYIVQNNTTGGQSITVKTSGGTGITVPNGRKAHLYVDGTNVIQMFDFVDINGGAIDGTTVGASSASTGAFTTLTASGATTLNGAVALGDAAADLITVPGTVNSNVIFTDNTFDIGASGATRPRTGYFGTSVLSPLVTATNVQVTNIKANDGTVAVTITDSTGAVGVSTAFTLSTATGNIALGTSQTSGTFTVGGASQTGNITLDQSTKAHTLNIGSGATENATTKTINIGTGGVSGSTTTITIGSSNGTTTTFNGTVNVTTLDLTNLEVTNIKAKDGTAAMSIADSTGVVTFTKDEVVNGVTVGRGAGAVSTNTAVGASALAANTTGATNVAVGTSALAANTTASNNTAVGAYSLLTSTTGDSNSAFGTGSLERTTTGSYNVAIGVQALTYNTTASNNTAVGYQAGYSNTTGTGLAALGYQAGYTNNGNGNTAIGGGNAFIGAALYANSSGNNNVGVGSGALTATTVSNNTAVGYAAATANTTGTFNVAVGTDSLRSNTIASNNTAVGYQAGYSNTAEEITAFGTAALYSNTTGLQNVAVGRGALYFNTTGSYNTGLGRQALASNTTASSNTAVGYQAGFSNTTGQFNTFLGQGAGYATTGDANIVIGSGAGGTITSGSGVTAIGYASISANTSTASNNTALGCYALRANSTGTMNTALGGGEYGVDYGALGYNTTGSYNTAVGHYALKSNTTASNNTAVGYQAGYSNVTGGANTFVGKQAGYSATGIANTFIGQTTGYFTTGSYNTFVGTGSTNAAGDQVTAGSKNTILGGYGGNQGGLDIRTASNYIVLSDGDGNPRQIIDSSGNLGLGVTPSAWGSSYKAQQVNARAVVAGDSTQTVLANNWFVNSSGTSIYIASAAATAFSQDAGVFKWFNAASGTANTATITNGVSYTIITSGNQTAFGAANNNVGTLFTATSSGTLSSGTVSQNISFTQAMTLDASGNLGVGTTSPSTFNQNQLYGAVIGNGTSLPGLTLYGGTTNGGSLNFADGTSGTDQYRGSVEYNHGSDYMAFRTTATERARISSDGTFRVKGAGTAGSTDAFQVSGSAPADAARLDSSGNLLVGQTNAEGRLTITESTANSAQIRINNTNRTSQYLTVGMNGSNGSGVTGWDDSAVIEAVQTGTATGTKALYLSAFSGPMIFATNTRTERARITSGGDVGIGTSSPNAKLHILAADAVTADLARFQQTNQGNLLIQSQQGGLNLGSANGILFSNATGNMGWRTGASSGDANMLLDASGNLGVGTTSPSVKLHVSDATNPSIRVTDTTNPTSVDIQAVDGIGYVGTPTNHPLALFTNGSERARITSGGYFKASDDGVYAGSANTWHEFNQSANSIGLAVVADNASLTSSVVEISAARNTTNNSYYFLDCAVSGVAYRFRVADSGNVTNTNGSYGTISDQKMKTDIVDAGSQWSDIKALRFRKFKMKDDPSGLVQLGVVAQEVEITSPGLVDEHQDRDAEGNDLGTTTKSVKTSVLLMKAAVALQEAMARIETLEAEVAALKGA